MKKTLILLISILFSIQLSQAPRSWNTINNHERDASDSNKNQISHPHQTPWLTPKPLFYLTNHFVSSLQIFSAKQTTLLACYKLFLPNKPLCHPPTNFFCLTNYFVGLLHFFSEKQTTLSRTNNPFRKHILLFKQNNYHLHSLHVKWMRIFHKFELNLKYFKHETTLY